MTNKVLLSAYQCDPSKGSESGRSWNWLRTYAEKGMEVWCLTDATVRESLDAALRQLNVPNIHVHYIRVPRLIQRFYQKSPGGAWIYLRYMAFQREACKEARRLDHQIDFDLVHHVSWGSVQLGTGLWRLGKPLVFGPVGGGQFPPPGFEAYFEDGFAKEMKRKRTSDFLARFYPDTKSTLRRADLVLTVNAETHAFATGLGARNVRYFLDATLEEQKRQPEMPRRSESATLRLLWVGRILPRKALPLALEALAKVKDEIPVHLDVYGGGEFAKRVPGWIHRHGLHDTVTWHKQVPWEEVFEAYKQSDCFLFTSLRESYGLQLMEAMSSGLPVICLDLHGAGHFVPAEVGIKVPANTPEQAANDLAAAIKHMHENPEERRRAGEKAFDYASRQGLQNKWDEYEGLLKQYNIL